MKKTPLLLSLTACIALTLSACGGGSVEDDRASAYASIKAMDSLSVAQVEDYQQQLNSAADSTAIDNIVASAQTANEERRAEKAGASATAAASANAVDTLTTALVGVTLTGTSPECKDMTLTLEGDGTWTGTAGDDACLGFINRPVKGSDNTVETYWQITGDDGGELVVTTSNGTNSGEVQAVYAVTVNNDGTVAMTAAPYQGTSDPVGVAGTHEFSPADSSAS